MKKKKTKEEPTLFDGMDETNALTKQSSTAEIKAYFLKIAELSESKERFPVDLDDVWPLVYGSKQKAVNELCNSKNEDGSKRYMKGIDYQSLNQKVEAGHTFTTIKVYKLSINCMEWFIARKIRIVFDIYSKVLHRGIAEEKNPDLIADRMIATYKRQGKSDKWIETRMKAKANRKQFAACLQKHGVVTPEGFKKCTNAIYTPLYGGGAGVVRSRKNLPDTANIRDNMSAIELAGVEFAEALSIHNIDAKNIKGAKNCEFECGKSSRIVAKAIIDSRQQTAF